MHQKDSFQIMIPIPTLCGLLWLATASSLIFGFSSSKFTICNYCPFSYQPYLSSNFLLVSHELTTKYQSLDTHVLHTILAISHVCTIGPRPLSPRCLANLILANTCDTNLIPTSQTSSIIHEPWWLEKNDTTFMESWFNHYWI